jgi:O-antigen/teichoic acid export membrane protein
MGQMNETPRRIIRNTLTNSASYGFLFISNIFLLPYVVHALGNQYYGGIWAILGTLTAYMGLLDLGTGMSLVKFISEFYTKGEEIHLCEVVNTGIASYATLGIAVLVVAWAAGETILSLIGVPQAIMQEAVFVLRIGMLALVIANIVSPVTSVLTGIQRMDINSYVSIGTQTLNIVGTITVLSAGYGVRGLILNNLMIVVLNSVCLGWFAFRFVPGLKLGVRYCSMAMLKKSLGYGANLQVSRLAQVILFQTDRILALRFFGEITSAYYAVGAQLTSAVRSIAFLSVSALVPAVAEMDAKQHHDTILVLYKRGSKYIAVIAAFLFIFVGVFIPQIMRVWMKDAQFLAATGVVRVLIFGYFLNVVTGVASSLAAGIGKTEFDRRYGVFTSVFNLGATISLCLLLGPIGIAMGTSLSLMLGALYYLRLFHSYVKVSPGDILRLFWRPILAGILAGMGALLVSMVLPGDEGSRILGAAMLSGVFLVYTGLFAGLLATFGVIDEYDRKMLRSLLRRSE